MEAFEQLLGEVAAAALGENGVGRAQLHSGRVVGAMLAGFCDAHVAGGDAGDAAVFVEHLGGGETGIDLDPQRLGLLAEPAADIAERGDVVALVVHGRRRRQADRAVAGEVHETVVGRRRGERGAALAPIRQQLIQRARLDDGAGQDVGADLCTFFDHADGGVGGELFQANGGGEAGWAGAHHHHVELHRFPGRGFGHLLFLIGQSGLISRA